MIEGAFDRDELAEMAALDCATVITTPEQAEMFAAASRVPQSAWIKLNTGMNRLGFGAELGDERIAHWCRSVRAKTSWPLGWMMHFADADTDSGWKPQAERFAQWQPRLRALVGDAGGEISLANSAASLMLPQTHADWVRPGIALYGATPYADGRKDHSAAAFGLKPTQSLSSKVIAIQNIKRGDAVGYGSRFKASRDSRIGVIAAGYADGYPRLARDGTPVWVQGQSVPIAGRVSMDLITVDLTDHPAVNVGADAELWGHALPIDTLAAGADTIGYELMTKVTARVARHIADGQR
jgi:alanine racemase